MSEVLEFSPRLLKAWTAAILVFILAPLLVVVLLSVTTFDYIHLPTEGVTLKWFRAALTNEVFIDAAVHSLVLAVVASLVALIVGTGLALAAVRYRFPGRGVIATLGLAPLFVPMVMIALALLLAANAVGVRDAWARLLIGHSILTLPYVVRTMTASLTGFDMNQELAARNLGASPLKAFALVTLPQLGPGLMAGGVFAFIISLDNVAVSIFLAGADVTTLPVQLFAYASYKSDPMVAAVSVLIIVFSLAIVALAEKFFGIQSLLRG